MEILFISVLSVLIFILYQQIRVRHKIITMEKPYNFKYPQGKDCKMVIDETLLQLNKEGKYVVIITDDSLSPDYSNGDFVIISRTIPEKIKRGLCVLVKTTEQHRCIAKICTAHRDGTWTVILDEFKFIIHKEEIDGIIENKIRRG